jgi:hypothetical protein
MGEVRAEPRLSYRDTIGDAMAILIPANAIHRVTIKYHYDLQLVENVYWIQSHVNNTNLDTIALDMRDLIVRKWQQVQKDTCVCESVIVQEVLPAPLDPFERSVGEAGLQTGDGLPQVMAVVASLKTGLGGRRNRGRKYIAGVLSAHEVAGRLEATAQGTWQAKADGIYQAFRPFDTVSNYTMGIMHRSLGGAPVPIAVENFVPVTQIFVQSILGTMRSRIPGHGA